MQRADLNALEEAEGYRALIDEFNNSQDEIARIVGKSRSHVANTLRLLKLSDAVKAHIRGGKLTAGHARMLIGAPDADALAEEIVAHALNVRQVEAIARERAQQNGQKRGNGRSSRKSAAKSADTLAFEKRISDATGLVVSIDHHDDQGTLTIRYRTLDQLDDLVQRLVRGHKELDEQLAAQGLVLRQGTMMDASVIRAKLRPPPMATGRGAVNVQEPDAGWTGRGGKTVLGYKAHIGVDQGSGLVRRLIVTGAGVYESEVADDLICGDERAVYGDRAYPLKARRARLKSLGIKDRIMHRADKHHPRITGWRARWNNLVSRRRAPVEAVFSAMKRLYGLARARSSALCYVAADVFAFVTIYNLRRAAILKAA